MTVYKKRLLLDIKGPFNIPIAAMPFEKTLGTSKEEIANLSLLSELIGGNKLRKLLNEHGTQLNLIKRRDTTTDREAIYSILLDINHPQLEEKLIELNIIYGIDNMLTMYKDEAEKNIATLEEKLSQGLFDLSKAKEDQRKHLANDYIRYEKHISDIQAKIYCIQTLSEVYRMSNIS